MEQQYIVMVAFNSKPNCMMTLIEKKENQSETPACSPLCALAQKAPKNLTSINDDNDHKNGHDNNDKTPVQGTWFRGHF